MKKFVFVIFFILILGGLLLAGRGVDSKLEYFFTNTSISDIGPKNIIIGQEVRGTVRVQVVCLKASGKGIASIDFGDASGEQELGNCFCVSVDEVDNVKCDFDFAHTFDSSGSFAVIPKVFAFSLGVTNPGHSTGLSETITVTEAPIPSPSIPADNPLTATEIAQLIRSIANVVFYIVSGLAVLLIMIGGFTILTAAGSPAQITRGRKIILFTAIGFAIMAIARGLIALIFKILGVEGVDI